jgi:diguanylate cyclase (GGDEF)-like protein
MYVFVIIVSLYEIIQYFYPIFFYDVVRLIETDIGTEPFVETTIILALSGYVSSYFYVVLNEKKIKNDTIEINFLKDTLKKQVEIFNSGKIIFLIQKVNSKKQFYIDFISDNAGFMKINKEEPFSNFIFQQDADFYKIQLEESIKNKLDLLEREYRIIVNGHHEYFFETTKIYYDANGIVEYLISYIVSIDQIKKQHESIKYLNTFDGKTGLENAVTLSNYVENLIKNKKGFYLIALAIDNLKMINNISGYETGNLIIKKISEHILYKIDMYDSLFSYNSNEFILVLEGDEEYEIIHKIQAIQTEISSLYQNKVTLSFGIAKFPEAKDYLDLIKFSKIALNKQKNIGRNGYSFYDKEYALYLEEMEAIKERLIHDIQYERDNFRVFFQPIIDSENNGNAVGCESLLRWDTERLGSIPPSKFIKVAEENNLIQAIGLISIEKTFDFISKNKLLLNKKEHFFSINVSPIQLKYCFIQQVSMLMNQFSILPEQIVFEITESSLISDEKEVVETILKLKEKGFLISIDDFGTGYSNLKYIKQFNVDKIKIDKTFIDDIGKNKGAEEIIKAILLLASGLNIGVIAEGIEVKEQLSFLTENNCYNIQGFYFSKPIDSKLYVNFLEKN